MQEQMTQLQSLTNEQKEKIDFTVTNLQDQQSRIDKTIEMAQRADDMARAAETKAVENSNKISKTDNKVDEVDGKVNLSISMGATGQNG